MQPILFEALSIFTQPHLLSRYKVLSTFTLTAPAACKPPSLVPAPRAMCLRLLQVICCYVPPLFRSWPAPRSLSSPGVLARRGSLCISMSLLRPPLFLLQILASSGFDVRVGWLFAKRREAKAPPLPGSCAPWSSPPANLVLPPRLFSRPFF